VTQAEWGAAIDALTKAMKFTDDKRNEYILFSDLLGVSSLVDMVNAATTGTPSSVLGPFHIEGAPELPNGGDLWKGQVGEPLVVSGTVRDAHGAPAKGAVLALWQNSGNGMYAQQDAKQSPTNYHARLTVADDGSFAFSTVRPVSYTVPDDGPAGDMLRALGRHAWRPAHLHMIIHAPGRTPLITEFFPTTTSTSSRTRCSACAAAWCCRSSRRGTARTCPRTSPRARPCRCRCGRRRSTSNFPRLGERFNGRCAGPACRGRPSRCARRGRRGCSAILPRWTPIIGARRLAGSSSSLASRRRNLVANAGGLLELEVGGGVAHALLELGDVAARRLWPTRCTSPDTPVSTV
jgi:protocatechuate 3,4-dioxygenase beta subunit